MSELSTDTQAILIILLVLIMLLVILIRMMLDKNKGRTGGGFISMMGATYELHTKNKQAAIQEILERNANKKMDEEKSGETKLERKKNNE